MSQIRAKLGMILCLLLVMVTFIPAASSKYVKSYPIDLELKTTLALGKLYWTSEDDSGKQVNVETFPDNEVGSPGPGYYMIMAKGGNGADSGNYSGGYGGIISAIFYFNEAPTFTIALGTSAKKTTPGYNAVSTEVLRGGSYPDNNAFAGGAGTTVFLGNKTYTEENLLVLAAGGGGAGVDYLKDYVCEYAGNGGAGGLNLENLSNYGYTEPRARPKLNFYCYHGEMGKDFGYGGTADEPEYSLAKGIVLENPPTSGGIGGPGFDEYDYEYASSFTCCGGAGYFGGSGNMNNAKEYVYGSAGGGSSLLSKTRLKSTTFDKYKENMKILLQNETELSGYTINNSGYLCDANGTVSDISFVGIYYLGIELPEGY